MQDPDLLKRLLAPIRRSLEAALQSADVPAQITAAVVELLLDVAPFVLLVSLLAVCGRALNAHTGRPVTTRSAASIGRLAVGFLLGAPLLAWIAHAPSSHLLFLFARADHVACCVIVGAMMSHVGDEVRKWALTLLSLSLLAQYKGPMPVALVFGACLIGFAAQRLPGARRAIQATFLHGTLLASVYLWALHVRSSNLVLGLEIHGLIFFIFLRHISFVVESCKGRYITPSNFLCYLSFYPGVTGPLGGPEVYDEFSRRNLRGRTNYDYSRAAKMMVAGVLQIWIAGRIPASTAALIASDSTPALWMNSLLLFGQTALKAMGYWSLIEATGLLYGIRLRKNFLRLLTLRDPSELWRSWRASLTNWLIVYVYAPLGANRRHQSWNIAAAFFVSWLWHALGVPFMTADFGLADLAPVTTWAMLSALAVIGHVQAQNRHITFLPIRPPAAVNRVLKTALTVALASFTVTMLSYQGAASDHFPGYLRMLLAIGE